MKRASGTPNHSNIFSTSFHTRERGSTIASQTARQSYGYRHHRLYLHQPQADEKRQIHPCHRRRRQHSQVANQLSVLALQASIEAILCFY